MNNRTIANLREGSKVQAIQTYDGIIWGEFTVKKIGAAVSGPGYWVTVEGIPETGTSPRKLSGLVYGHYAFQTPSSEE